MDRPTRELPPLTPRAVELLTELRRPSTLRDTFLGREQRDTAILDEMRELAEPRLVVFLLDALFGAPNAVAQAAARAVSATLERLPVTRLARLENDCRQHSPYTDPYRLAWTSLRPADLRHFRGWGAVENIITGIASFHPSGYVREAAVERLDALPGSQVLAFAVLRLNDWVREVADRALGAVQRRLTAEHADALVDCLPLFATLGRSTRRDHRRIIDEVSILLRQPAQQTALERGFRSADRVVRRMCFRLARESGTAGDTLVTAALRDSDPTIRLAAVTDAVATVELSRLDGTIRDAYADRFHPVRRVAIDLAATRLSVSDATPWLERALLDRSRGVREVARFHVARLGVSINVAQYYRNVIAEETSARKLVAALSGLRETGSASDARLALGSTSHERALVRRAAVRTVAALDAAHHLDNLVEMLRDPSRAVTRATAEALVPHAGSIGLDGIRAALRSPRPPNAVHAVSLAAELGKWNSLIALLEFAQDPDDEVRASVARWLTDWLARQNRAFNAPTTSQIGAIRRVLAAHGDSLESETRENIAQTVAYWSSGR